jgi:hypothetical protein
MLIVFNIVVILMVLLIAYWWANQGLFSSILHLLCVIAAGAIALSLWEPLTVGVLLRGTFFDDYAWGVSLVMMFVILLAVFRVATNKLVPSNVTIPHWADLTFGFATGAVSGILTVGIFITGAGFIQSTRSILGWYGAGRATRDAQVGVLPEDRLWLPVHEITYEFYSWLSVTSLESDQPLRQWNPRADWLAAALVRDSVDEGKGKLSLQADAMSVQDVTYSQAVPDKTLRPVPMYAVKLNFKQSARDWGEQLTLSSSQIRLIGTPADPMAEAPVAFPIGFTQWSGHDWFDGVSKYISSEPAQESSDVIVEFKASDIAPGKPRFIQVRGTRFNLPASHEVNAADFLALRNAPGTSITVTLDANAAAIDSAIEISNRISPILISTNQMPPGIAYVDRFLTEGKAEFNSGGDRPSRNLMIEGIYQPEGTRIVRVDVSRESPANIYGPIRQRVKDNDQIVLVDSSGRPYSPMGYFYERPDHIIVIELDPSNFIPINKIPQLPASNGGKLALLFSVTANSTIAGLKYGQVTVGTCKVPVPPDKKHLDTTPAPDKPDRNSEITP